MRRYKLIGGPRHGEWYDIDDGIECLRIDAPCDDVQFGYTTHEYKRTTFYRNGKYWDMFVCSSDEHHQLVTKYIKELNNVQNNFTVVNFITYSM